MLLREFGIAVEDNLHLDRSARDLDEEDSFWLTTGKLRRRVRDYMKNHAFAYGPTIGGLHMFLRRNAHFPSTKADPDWERIARLLGENGSSEAS